jgi:hypothetical protein
MRKYWKNVEAAKVHGLLWPYGLKISDDEMEVWARWKLVPTPSDRYTINPQVVMAEFAACSYLIHRCGWDPSNIRTARDYVVGSVEGKADSIRVLDGLYTTLALKDRADEYLDACAWLLTVIKFSLGFPAQAGIGAVVIPSDTGEFVFAAEPAQTDSIVDVDGKSRHPRPVGLTEARVVSE